MVEYELALYYIERILEKQDGNASLARFNLPVPRINFDSGLSEPNPLMREEQSYIIDRDKMEEAWSTFNPGQRHAATTILNAVDNPSPGRNLFFLNGAGGTGKTHVQNAVLQKLRSRGDIALAVASSGIAATLLQGGTTAHSKFKIPLDADQQSTCNITKSTNLACLFRAAKLIFWDEAPMQSRFDMEAVHRCLTDLCSEEEEISVHFAGKVVCFCGDFRQTLPVIPGGRRAESVAKSIQKSPFWGDVQILYLTENMRLRNPNLSARQRQRTADFAAELLQIGNGETIKTDAFTRRPLAKWSYGWIDNNDRSALIRSVYPNLAKLLDLTPNEQASYLSERAILAVTNHDVNNINAAILRRMGTETQVFWSSDKAKALEDELLYPPEYWSVFDEPSIAPHRLELKIGMTVMVLRNMDPPRVCNGTRLRIVSMNRHIIKATILTGAYSGQIYLAHRILMESKENDWHAPCSYVRKQFPLRPAFAMTVNKAQGQSLKYVGVDLKARPCFTHGQLYVALSRVTNMENLWLMGSDRQEDVANRELVNVVYREVLLPDCTQND